MPAPNKTPVTASNALFTFYDIESLQNAFTLCAYNPKLGELEIYVLISDELAAGLRQRQDFSIAEMCEIVKKSNPAMPEDTSITFYDLRLEANNQRLASVVGLSDASLVNDPSQPSTYGPHARPVCDTDPDYDPLTKHPFLAGYNSFNYDTTILSLYLMEAFAHMKTGGSFTPVDPARIRGYNDGMFSADFIKYMPSYLVKGPVSDGMGWQSVPHKIRQAMISSGRHLDVARLNEKQTMVQLKRLLGTLGYQILESDRLSGPDAVLETTQDIYELIAYNVSDVVNLGFLFDHPVYSGSFDLRQGLIEEYPETVYDRIPGTHKPDIRPQRVRRNRLGPDSTSAKFVSYILAPYADLEDIEAVDLTYPAPEIAAEMGIEPFNVLEEAKKFFYQNVSDPAARARFDEVYEYYASIQGKNFNDSEGYHDRYPGRSTHQLSEIPKRRCTIPYFRLDGTPTSCYVLFSYGGIHGAEADMSSYQAHLEEHQRTAELFAEVQSIHPHPLDMRLAKTVTLSDGTEVPFKDVLTSKSTIKALTQRKEDIAALGDNPSAEQLAEIEEQYKGLGYKDFGSKRPQLFIDNPDGSNKLTPKYGYTSAVPAIHEDFTSYYPNMLRNMRAFYNPQLGEDRYAKIFWDKERYGKLMKDPSVSPEDRKRYKILREGTKLILNSASGAGDATHKTSIRMNNQIISMRLMGQLFSWMVGQAQAFAGARIVSTNTDGLYSAGLDEETNNRVLAEQAARIHVDIEPEPLLLVSKDANNRLELALPEAGRAPWDMEIVSASGGDLSCYAGPDPNKRLNHAAILDHGLVEYMRLIMGRYVPEGSTEALRIDRPMNRDVARGILERVITHDDPVHAAMMFQNIIAASRSSMRYPFACDLPSAEDDVEKGSQITGARTLQHLNRVFITKPGTPGAMSLRLAAAATISTTVASRRRRDPEARSIQDDPLALELLRSNGLERNRQQAIAAGTTLIPDGREAAIIKITGIDPHWPMVVLNEDLHCLAPERLQQLLESLDLEVYLNKLTDLFDKSWMNPSTETA